MKKYILVSVSLVIASVLVEWINPSWWLFILVTIAAVLIARLKSPASFWIPFLTIGIYYIARMLWYNQAENELSKMMAELLGVGSSLVLILISALLYALLAGLAGWSAHLLLAAFNKID